MNPNLIVIIISITFQLLAALVAVRLVFFTRKYAAGILVILATFLMAFRRSISLYRVINGETVRIDLFAELIGCVVSFLFLIGVVYLTRLIFSATRDITERRKAEDKLRLSQQRLALHVYQTPLAVIEFDIDGRVREWNPAAARVFGFSCEEAIGQYWTFIVPEAVWPYLDGVWAAIVEQRGGSRSTNENLTRSGRIISCEWFNTPLVDPNGTTIGVASLVMDVSESRKTEKKLFESEERFRLAMMGANDGLWDWNLKTDEVYYSPRWKSMLGYAEEELESHLDAWKRLIHPDDMGPALSFIRSFLEGHAEKYELEFRLQHKGGHYLNILSRASLVCGSNGEALRLVGTHVDITDRKQAEDKIRTSLEEKEVLLREVHHRVKNNLNVIISLLNLQSNYISEPAMISIFQDSQNRIRSMARIHEKLYQAKDFTRVDYKEYINALITDLSSSYIHMNGKVRIISDVQDLFLDLDAAIPCGLIINELVTNALKYAFPDDRSGELFVSMFSEDGNYVLSIGDNGIGLPEGFDLNASKTLGLQLVSILVRQVDGTLQTVVNNGTEFRIAFTGKTAGQKNRK